MSSPHIILTKSIFSKILLKYLNEKEKLLLLSTVILTICAIVYGNLYVANKYYIPIAYGSSIYTDYSVYYDAALRFKKDPLTLYSTSAPHEKGGSFNYPPFSLVLFYPLSYLPIPLSYMFFSTLNTLCCGAAGWLALKALRRYSNIYMESWKKMFFLFLCVGITPVVQNAKHAQINGIIVLLSISAVYLLLQKKYIFSSILISIGFGFKLYPVLLLVPLGVSIFLDKDVNFRLRNYIFASTAFIAVQVLTLSLIPFSLYTFYFLEYVPLLSGHTCLSGFNQSLSGIILRLTTPSFSAGSWEIVEIPFAIKVLTLLFQLTGAISVAFIMVKERNNLYTFFLCSLIMVSMPIFSPLGWEYVYVMCIPLIAIAYFFGYVKENKNMWLMALVNLVILILCIPKLGDDVLVRLQNVVPDFVFHVYFLRWFVLMILLAYILNKYLRNFVKVNC